MSSFIRGFTSLFMEQLEEERQRLAEEAKAVEYRTRHVDIENISSSEDAIEAAYKAQFPDYQLLFDEEVQAQAQMQGEEVSEEVKETLTKEVFNKVAHGSDAVGIEAIKEVVTQSGMEEKVIDDV